MTRKQAAVLVPLLLLAALGVWQLTQGPSPAPPPANDDPTATPTAGAGMTDSAAPTDSSARGLRPRTTPTGNDETPNGREAPDRVTFFGRVVRSPHDEALAGASVTVRRADADGDASGATSAAMATTTGDGTFELETGFDAWLDTLTVEVAATGCAPRRGTFVRPEAGSRIDLGDIALQRAIAVQGVIIDDENAPVADARLMFVYIELGRSAELNAENTLRATSDAAGRFAFAVPAFAGEWYVGTEYTGALIEPRSVKLGPDLTEYDLRIVVERPDPRHSITGIVVDEQNRPLADVHVSATGGGFVGRGRSGPDGRFAVERAGPMPHRGKDGALLSCSSEDRMYRRIAPANDARIPWGTAGVEIVMQRRQGCTVRVVDATGKAVETYALFAFRGDGTKGLSRYPHLLRRGRHPDGRCILDGLDPGPNSVLVVPRSADVPASGLVPFVVGAGLPSSEVLVTLPEPAALAVELTDPAGRPMPDSDVELIGALGRSELEPATRVSPLSGLDRGRGTPGHVLFGAATTDAGGRAEVTLPPGRYFVRATSPRHVALVQPVEVFAPATTARLQVEAAAQIQASLGPADALARLRELGAGGGEPLAIVVTPAEGDAPPAAPVDATGTATVGGLTAGRHEVALRYWLTTSAVRSGAVVLPVATVDLGGGKLRELTVDVAPLLPATTFGRVVAGGVPLADVHCFLRPAGKTGQNSSLRGLRVATDADGRYRGLVPPGEYGFTVTYPAQPGPGWVVMQLAQTWTLAAGETREQDFDFPLRRAHIRIEAATGEPAVGRMIAIKRPGYHLPGGLETDTGGRVEVFPAPLLPFRVEVRGGEGAPSHTFEGVDLPSGNPTGEITLRLPG